MHNHADKNVLFRWVPKWGVIVSFYEDVSQLPPFQDNLLCSLLTLLECHFLHIHLPAQTHRPVFTKSQNKE